MNTAFCIGIEGVGMRQSLAVLASRQGKILSAVRQTGEPISLHTTPRDLLPHRILHLLHTVLNRAKLELNDLARCTVCIGLTGVTFKYDRVVDLPEILNPLELGIANLICTGDAEIVFAAYAQTEQGSLVLSHSGSTAYVVGKKAGELKHFRYGGWGPAFGDEGSAYALGRATLRAIGSEYDSGASPSLLWYEVHDWLMNPDPTISTWSDGSEHWKLLLDKFHQCKVDGIDPRTLLFHFAHSIRQHGIPGTCLAEEGAEVWRKIAAGLATPLLRAFNKRDETAETIVENAITALAAQHAAACNVAKKQGYSVIEPIVYAGGILSHHPVLRERLTDKLQHHVKTKFVPVTIESSMALRPVLGALLFALGDSKQELLKLPEVSIIETVRSESRLTAFERELKND